MRLNCRNLFRNAHNSDGGAGGALVSHHTTWKHSAFRPVILYLTCPARKACVPSRPARVAQVQSRTHKIQAPPTICHSPARKSYIELAMSPTSSYKIRVTTRSQGESRSPVCRRKVSGMLHRPRFGRVRLDKTTEGPCKKLSTWPLLTVLREALTISIMPPPNPSQRLCASDF